MGDLLDSFSIKLKLAIMSAMALGGILLMMLLKFSFAAEIHAHQTSLRLLDQVNLNMLMLRRSEKDFLARLDMKYVESFNQQYQSVVQLNQQLAQSIDQIDFDDKSAVSQIQQVFSNYHQSFNQIVKSHQTIGLNPTSGLYGQLRDVVHQTETLINQQNNQKLLADLLMLRRHEKDFMLRHEIKYIDNFSQDHANMVSDLAKSNFDNAQRQAVESSLQQYADTFYKLSEQSKVMGLNHESGELGKMREIIHQSEQLLEQKSSQLDKFIQKQMAENDFLFILLSLLIMLLMGLLIFAVYSSINSPLQYLTQVMNRANSENNLALRANMKGAHEVAQLARVFDLMMTSFSNVLEKIDKASEQVSAASVQLSRINQSSTNNIHEQEALIEQVATAMEEMTVSVQNVAQNIAETASSADNAYQETSTGKSTVTATVSSVTALVDQIQRAKDVLDELNQDSDNVSKVLEVIGGVAEQTNLLALNAAIEAARAGEQGRGFAVVADEVRTLAGRTQQSTAEINQIIERLQTNSRQAVEVMEKSRGQVSDTVNQAQQAGEALDIVINKVDQINNMSSQIASAASQQSSAVEEINRNLSNIRTQAASNSSNAEQTSEASNKQAALAKDLKALVSLFKY